MVSGRGPIMLPVSRTFDFAELSDQDFLHVVKVKYWAMLLPTFPGYVSVLKLLNINHQLSLWSG